MSERCETCRFWRVERDGDITHHTCRRFPPTHATITGFRVDRPSRKWPATYYSDWCGEWAERARTGDDK